MFKEDPRERISLEDISKHPWFIDEELPTDEELIELRKKLEDIRLA